MESEVIIDVKDIRTRFHARSGYIYAVNGVSFKVRRGETLGVVGESGCGKSVTMLSLLHLLPPAAEIAVVAGVTTHNLRGFTIEFVTVLFTVVAPQAKSNEV